jgi:hypothetical protein
MRRDRKLEPPTIGLANGTRNAWHPRENDRATFLGKRLRDETILDPAFDQRDYAVAFCTVDAFVVKDAAVRYVFANDDVAGQFSNTATFYTVGAEGTLTQKKSVMTGARCPQVTPPAASEAT